MRGLLLRSCGAVELHPGFRPGGERKWQAQGSRGARKVRPFRVTGTAIVRPAASASKTSCTLFWLEKVVSLCGISGTGFDSPRAADPAQAKVYLWTVMSIVSARVEPGRTMKTPGLSRKSPSKPAGSVIPCQGSMQMKGAPGFVQRPR